MKIKSILPTYQEGKPDVTIKTLEPFIIDNLRYNQSQKYKLLIWIARELSKIGYCFFIIKPESFSK